MTKHRLVVVGNGGTLRTSSDGLTWSTRSTGTSQNLNGVARSGSLFVATGAAGTVLTAP